MYCQKICSAGVQNDFQSVKSTDISRLVSEASNVAHTLKEASRFHQVVSEDRELSSLPAALKTDACIYLGFFFSPPH